MSYLEWGAGEVIFIKQPEIENQFWLTASILRLPLHFICLRFKFATKQRAIREKDVSLSQQNIQQASTWPQHKGNK